MPSQACEPCAKRKVRCDREEPCTNCKRRQDRCVYTELGLVDRVKKLETLVRALGGDPDDDLAFQDRLSTTASLAVAARSPNSHKRQRVDATQHSKSTDPLIIEEDGQQYYLECRAFLTHGHRQSGDRNANAKNPLLLRNAPHALQSVICHKSSSNTVTARYLQDKAEILWTTFKQRVHPLVKILFSWDLERLEGTKTLLLDSVHDQDADEALRSAIYLSSVVSLTDAECRTRLGQAKTSILSDCQTFCEEALAKANILAMKNIAALKAVTLYIMASLDRLSTQSLWTLMGLAVRNGEKLGIHRDGTFLGLAPAETEDRRRLWWQLQYIDLVLAIRLGATPLTLTADWDVKLPLNIEDTDLTPDMKTFPEERKGLTSMSYCMFTFYVLDQQRQYHADKGRFELSWMTNQTVKMRTKESFIDRLEDELNRNFLQYCDPIRPLDVLIQTIARALICVFRQRILLTISDQPSCEAQDNRDMLLATSMQSMEYSIILHSHHLLRDFRWLSSNGFPWPAFMVVLVETQHETDANKCERIWTLLADLYAVNTALLELAEDRRRLHAAELISAAWKTCQIKGTVGNFTTKPEFVVALESRLAECLAEASQGLHSQGSHQDRLNNDGGVGREATQNIEVEQDFNTTLLDMDFQDIDWSFWNSID